MASIPTEFCHHAAPISSQVNSSSLTHFWPRNELRVAKQGTLFVLPSSQLSGHTGSRPETHRSTSRRQPDCSPFRLAGLVEHSDPAGKCYLGFEVHQTVWPATDT